MSRCDVSVHRSLSWSPEERQSWRVRLFRTPLQRRGQAAKIHCQTPSLLTQIQVLKSARHVFIV